MRWGQECGGGLEKLGCSLSFLKGKKKEKEKGSVKKVWFSAVGCNLRLGVN